MLFDRHILALNFNTIINIIGSISRKNASDDDARSKNKQKRYTYVQVYQFIYIFKLFTK